MRSAAAGSTRGGSPPGKQVERLEREPPLGQVLRAGEAPPGDLFYLPEPVTERLLMHVHLGGGVLPGSVGADKRADRVDIVRAVRTVVSKQRAEDLVDE